MHQWKPHPYDLREPEEEPIDGRHGFRFVPARGAHPMPPAVAGMWKPAGSVMWRLKNIQLLGP